MNTEDKGFLDTLAQEKIDADTDFQDSLDSLEEDEREQAIQEKRKEIIEQEFSSLKESSKKQEELANNYKIRAEKAEKAKKEDHTSKKEEDSDLSPKDLYALINAQVPQEDVEEVVKASKLLGKTVQEALNDDIVKTILETRQEFRKTAEATNTKQARPGSKKVSDDELLKKASAGDVPEKGSEEAERLFWAKRGGERK